MMILADSNILVYSINASSAKHKTAQEFITKNQQNLFISHQNIFESLRILTHPKFPNPMDTNNAVRSLMEIADPVTVIFPKLSTHYLAIELIKKYRLKSDKIFDAYLVATMLSNNIKVIATDNTKDFKMIKEIEVFNPFEGI